MSQVCQQKRRRAPELVHGLSETVELKDWEYAIILAALKLYIRKAEATGKTKGTITFAKHLRAKLNRSFTRLIKDTKREHRRLKNLLTHAKDLTDYS